MKKPTWAIVTGIIGIIMGLFGILGAIQTFMMPQMLKLQKQFWEQMQAQKGMEQQSQEALKMMNAMFNAPDWFATWCMIAGVIGVAVAIFYLVSAILLLMTKKVGVTLFYSAVGVSIAFTVLKSIVTYKALSAMGVAMLVWSFVAVLINIVLLVIVAMNDKSAFKAPVPA